MLILLAEVIPYSDERVSELEATYFSYGVLFYHPGPLADDVVEIVSEFNDKTLPIFQIMVVDCQLPEHAEFCSIHGASKNLFLKYFNIEKEEKTAVYDGDFEKDDLWLDLYEEISNPWNVSPQLAAIPPFLANNTRPALFLFTPGPEVPLLFIKLGFMYGEYVECIWQPGFKSVEGFEDFQLFEGLRPGKLNLAIAFNDEYTYYEGKWSKTEVSQFLNNWIVNNMSQDQQETSNVDREL